MKIKWSILSLLIVAGLVAGVICSVFRTGSNIPVRNKEEILRTILLEKIAEEFKPGQMFPEELQFPLPLIFHERAYEGQVKDVFRYSVLKTSGPNSPWIAETKEILRAVPSTRNANLFFLRSDGSIGRVAVDDLPRLGKFEREFVVRMVNSSNH